MTAQFMKSFLCWIKLIACSKIFCTCAGKSRLVIIIKKYYNKCTLYMYIMYEIPVQLSVKLTWIT